MNKTWVAHEVCVEDENGLDPLGFQHWTKAEADADLRMLLPRYPGAFIVRVVHTRLGKNAERGTFQAV